MEPGQNELTLVYQSNETTRIRLFSEQFVERSKSKCHLVIEGTKIDLCSYYIFNAIGKHVVILINPENDIIDMSSMFDQCEWLRSLSENSKWNTEKVTNMNHLFSHCKRLSYITPLSTWDTREVEDMNSMFYGCTSISNLPDISKWKTGKVKNMSWMFYECKSLSFLPDISKWDV